MRIGPHASHLRMQVRPIRLAGRVKHRPLGDEVGPAASDAGAPIRLAGRVKHRPLGDKVGPAASDTGAPTRLAGRVKHPPLVTKSDLAASDAGAGAAKSSGRFSGHRPIKRPMESLSGSSRWNQAATRCAVRS